MGKIEIIYAVLLTCMFWLVGFFFLINDGIISFGTSVYELPNQQVRSLTPFEVVTCVTVAAVVIGGLCLMKINKWVFK